MANFFDQFDGGTESAAAVNPHSRDLAIRTIYGEAGNEPLTGQVAVANVIKNRADTGRYGGSDVGGVVLARGQFEPWMRSDAQKRMMALSPDSPEYKQIGQIFDGVMSGDLSDPTKGATHFYSPGGQAAMGRAPPSWDDGEGQKIGGHMFFAPEGRAASKAAPGASNFFDQFDPPAAANNAPPITAAPATAPQPAFVDRGGNGITIRPPGTAPVAPVPPQVEDRGGFDAAARGVAQGVTGNFSDEIRGLVEASGANPDDPASVYKLLSGALKYWGGDAEAKKRYDETVARERALNEAAQEQHPAASAVGNIAGGVLMPIPGGNAVQGAKLGERILQGIKQGGIYGTVAGAGEGQGALDTLEKATAGGLVGGAVGGAAVPAIAAAGRVVDAVKKPFEPIANLIRGGRDPDAQAARIIAGARAKDARGGNLNGMSQAEVDAARRAGHPVVQGDVGGEAVRGIARDAANTSPEAKAALDAAVGNRFHTQSARTAAWLRNEHDYPNGEAALERLRTAARRENRPAYEKAYNEGPALWTQDLHELSAAPIMQQAMRIAGVTGRNKAALDGFVPVRNPFITNPQTGRLELRINKDGSFHAPSLQFWDHVKRALDTMGAEGQTFSRALRAHLDELVPSYQQARSGAAKWFGAEDAFDAGGKFATMGGLDARKLAEARSQFAKFGPSDQKLFRANFVEHLIAKVEQLKDGQDVVKNIFNSEFARKQIELALGERGAQRLEAHLQVERALDRLRPAVQGNSSTARQLLQAGIASTTSPTALATAAGGISAYSSGNIGPGDAIVAGLTFASRKGKLHIDENVARRVGQMLASDSAGAINAAETVIAKTPWLLKLFRKLELPASKVSAITIKPNIPAIQAAAISRAQDQQPNVNGPPGQ